MVQEYSSMFNTGQSLYEKIQLYFTKWFFCLLEMAMVYTYVT